MSRSPSPHLTTVSITTAGKRVQLAVVFRRDCTSRHHDAEAEVWVWRERTGDDATLQRGLDSRNLQPFPPAYLLQIAVEESFDLGLKRETLLLQVAPVRGHIHTDCFVGSLVQRYQAFIGADPGRDSDNEAADMRGAQGVPATERDLMEAECEAWQE